MSYLWTTSEGITLAAWFSDVPEPDHLSGGDITALGWSVSAGSVLFIRRRCL